MDPEPSDALYGRPRRPHSLPESRQPIQFRLVERPRTSSGSWPAVGSVGQRDRFPSAEHEERRDIDGLGRDVLYAASAGEPRSETTQDGVETTEPRQKNTTFWTNVDGRQRPIQDQYTGRTIEYRVDPGIPRTEC